MRNTTERPEGIVAGTLKLVGTNEEIIYQTFKELLENEVVYHAMAHASNPYGGECDYKKCKYSKIWKYKFLIYQYLNDLSDTENLVTVMWANEAFDPEHPDTFGEPV